MRIHYIDDQDKKIVYFPDNKRFFKVNDTAQDLISDIDNGVSGDLLTEKYNISYDQLGIYKSYMTDPVLNLEANESLTKSNVLNRLVIHLTNDCNLRCKYCYANGGTYLSDKDIISYDIADKILKFFFDRFDNINYIQFFGGEPLLNVPILKYICEQVNELNKHKNTKTNFGLVTNGTILNDEIIYLVKEFNIDVTISYDGNPEVNDLMRYDINGSGTSNKIIRNMQMLKQETGKPNTIEVTYNRNHVKNNVGILDVVRHIQEILPNTYVHLVPAGGDEDTDFTIQDLSIFSDSIYELYEELNHVEVQENVVLPSYSLADRIFSALANKDRMGSPYICDAGLGTISVSTKGDIYPCFMFTDQPDLCYGNINDENVFNSTQSLELQNKLDSFSIKENNKECKECFINTLCNGCLGLNSFHSGNPFILSKEICNMFRDMTEAAIICHTRRMDNLNENTGEEQIV